MVRYYNQWYTSTLVFNPGNKIFLDFSDIYTIYPSTKLLYGYFKPYIVEKQVEPIQYCIKLLFVL